MNLEHDGMVVMSGFLTGLEVREGVGGGQGRAGTLASGAGGLDALLGGGVRAGEVVELLGSGGRTSLGLSLLSQSLWTGASAVLVSWNSGPRVGLLLKSLCALGASDAEARELLSRARLLRCVTESQLIRGLNAVLRFARQRGAQTSPSGPVPRSSGGATKESRDGGVRLVYVDSLSGPLLSSETAVRAEVGSLVRGLAEAGWAVVLASGESKRALGLAFTGVPSRRLVFAPLSPLPGPSARLSRFAVKLVKGGGCVGTAEVAIGPAGLQDLSGLPSRPALRPPQPLPTEPLIKDTTRVPRSGLFSPPSKGLATSTPKKVLCSDGASAAQGLPGRDSPSDDDSIDDCPPSPVI